MTKTAHAWPLRLPPLLPLLLLLGVSAAPAAAEEAAAPATADAPAAAEAPVAAEVPAPAAAEAPAPVAAPAPAVADAPAAAPAVAEAPKVAATPAPAPAARPTDRLYLGSLSVIRLNPLGLETQNKLAFQHRLYNSTSPLTASNWLEAALMLKLNPAYFKLGPILEIQPASIANLRLGYEYVNWFGTLGYLQSYNTPEAAYDDSIRGDDLTGFPYATTGHHLFVEPVLQMKVGPIAIRAKWAIEFWNVALGDGAGDGTPDTVFYDATLDTLVPAQGMVWSNETSLIYSKGKLTLGLQYTAVHPVYTDANFGGTTPTGFDSTEHRRIGPLIAYSFNTREYSGFNKPTLSLVTGVYLQHNFRTVSTPYILLGYSFNSDFLKKKG